MKQTFKQNCLDLLYKAILASTNTYYNGQYAISTNKLQTALDVISQHIDLRGTEERVITAAQKIVHHEDFAWEPAKWQFQGSLLLAWEQLLSPFMAFLHKHSNSIITLAKKEIAMIMSDLNRTPSEARNAIETIFADLQEDFTDVEKNNLQKAMQDLEVYLEISKGISKVSVPIPSFLGNIQSVYQYQQNLRETFELSKTALQRHPDSNYKILDKLFEEKHQYLMEQSEKHKDDLENGKYKLQYQPIPSTWECITKWLTGNPLGESHIAYELSRIVDEYSPDVSMIEKEILDLPIML